MTNRMQSDVQAARDTAKSNRVWCRLCSCEGVKGTVLCKEHLEGFEYAEQVLRLNGHASSAKLLTVFVQQRKE